MTKKHFEWAAAYVRRYNADQYVRLQMEGAFVALFNEFNPRFNEAQFRAACRGEDFVTHTYSGRAVTRRYSKAS